MDIHLSQHDGIPVYLQIIQQVKQLIAAGRLAKDQELLPIRVLAEELLINPNTVARAYRELENEGWIYKRRGAGTFVAELQTALSQESCEEQLTERIDSLLAEAKHMNISVSAVIKLVRERAKKLQI